MSELGLFIAGAASGLVEGLVVQPIDMIKTRHQLNVNNNESLIKSFRSIYNEGGIGRFYRGMLPELIGVVPKSSGMYASYELVYRRLGEETSLNASIAGFAAGIIEALIVTPSQVLKVRLQAKEHIGRYKGPKDCIMKIYQNEGILGFATGLGATIYRNCVWNTVYFGTMHWLKQQVPKRQTKVGDLSMTFVTGFVGGLFATCFNAPFDVVKSRIQSQVKIKGGKPLKYNYTIPSLITIYKDEGLSSCYKGIRPKALRMGLGGAIAMVTFELFQSILV